MAGMGGKVNTGAMETQMNNKMKLAKTKERIRAKAEANAKIRLEQQALQAQQAKLAETAPAYSEEEVLKFIGYDEKPERTPRDSKKKKKGKK